jgi:hypothetical protein
MLTDAAYLRTAPHFTEVAKTLTVSTTTAALSTALSAGYYRLVSDIDVWFIQCGGSGTGAATTNTHFLPSGSREYMAVTGSSDQNVAAITDAGSGTLWISKLV